ncbi:MAG: hypothetical protein CML17_06765 [Pusillimonas sp.]|nr:hypothetical protein [Pusillimonas sp.]|tara:strand:+ start:532 stop:1164 length:633 start_codon:yes stop_codon:yes gene_type:complete
MILVMSLHSKMDSPTPLINHKELPELGDSLGFLICDTARYVKRVLYTRLAPYGIPGGCWFVLRVLWQLDGVSQRELSATLGLADPALLMKLRTLERLGFVTRARDPGDKRRMCVFLTKRAHDLKGELLGIAGEVNFYMHAAMTEAQRQALMSGLASVHEQLVMFCVDADAPRNDDSINEKISHETGVTRHSKTLIRHSQIRARKRTEENE